MDALFILAIIRSWPEVSTACNFKLLIVSINIYESLMTC